jgi:hypothetical protein
MFARACKSLEKSSQICTSLDKKSGQVCKCLKMSANVCKCAKVTRWWRGAFDQRQMHGQRWTASQKHVQMAAVVTTPPTLVRVIGLDCQRGGEKTRVWHPGSPGLRPKTIPPCSTPPFPSPLTHFLLTSLPRHPTKSTMSCKKMGDRKVDHERTRHRNESQMNTGTECTVPQNENKHKHTKPSLQS